MMPNNRGSLPVPSVDILNEMIDMNSESIQALRDRVTDCYGQGAYRKAAHYMHRLEVLGDRSKGWWTYALMLAGALGDASIIDTSIRVLARDRKTLIRALKSAWSKAVSEHHLDLAKELSHRLLDFAPNDTDFRILNLLEALNSDSLSETSLKRLTSKPLPLASIDPELLRTLIGALKRAGFTDDASRMLDYLITKHPPVEPAVCEQTAQLAYSLKRYTVAMSLTADRPELRLRHIRGLACLQALAWDDLQKTQLSRAELHTLLEEDPDWQPSMLFHTLMLPGYTNADHSALARRAISWMQAGVVPSHVRPEKRPARLRIGYLSGDFKKHPCNQLACPVLEAHDQSRFEIIAFDNSRDDESPERQRILAAFNAVVVARNLSIESLAQAIREAGIDILVDMSGHTGDSRLAVLAHRPAPVQITWLGFPGSIGGTLADYLVTDTICVPDGMEEDFDEALIRLPVADRPGGEFPLNIMPPDRNSQGLPDDALVLACFNQQAKISFDSFQRWCQILRVVSNSVLWLVIQGDDVRERLRSVLTEQGVDPNRLYWAPRCQHVQHVQRIACADLILDSHPYGMHTTAVDAIAAGVPFLTFYGETLAGRVSSSLLHTAHLDDCVCADAEDYVERMVMLAENTTARTMLRERFYAARTDSPIFDNKSFARHLEKAYNVAYERWLAGEKPANITIEQKCLSPKSA